MAAFRAPVDFTPDERSVLTTVARMLAQALSRAHLQESERELSDGLQRTMMPTREPDIAGMTRGRPLRAHRRRAPGRRRLVRRDRPAVRPHRAGHRRRAGPRRAGGRADGPAADRTARLRVRGAPARTRCCRGPRASWPGSRRPTEDGDDALDLADQRFATCLYLEVDPVNGTLDIARAGHPDPAIRLGDGTTIIRHTAGRSAAGRRPRLGLSDHHDWCWSPARCCWSAPTA